MVTDGLTGHQNGDIVCGMQLSHYLKTNGMSDDDFGQLIGVTRQAVHRYKTFERFPEKVILGKILSATSGAVTPNDFFQMQEGA